MLTSTGTVERVKNCNLADTGDFDVCCVLVQLVSSPRIIGTAGARESLTHATRLRGSPACRGKQDGMFLHYGSRHHLLDPHVSVTVQACRGT